MMINLGMSRVADCSDCGTAYGGLEYEFALAKSPTGGNTFGVGVNTALGIGKPIDDDGSFQSLSVSLPVSLSLGSGAQTVTPFVTPGIGYGRVSGGGDSEGGTRTMIGAGVTVSGLGPLEITGSVRKVFLDEAPTLYGIAIGFGK